MPHRYSCGQDSMDNTVSNYQGAHASEYRMFFGDAKEVNAIVSKKPSNLCMKPSTRVRGE